MPKKAVIKPRKVKPPRKSRSKSVGQQLQTVEQATVSHARRFLVGRIGRVRFARRPILLWITGVLVIIGLVIGQQVVSGSAYKTTVSAAGGVFAEGALGPIETLNPLYARSSAEESAARLLFSRLFTYDESGMLKGDLAVKQERLDDEKRYRITLRDDVFWSDGHKLTVDDVLFTISLMKNPATRIPEGGWSDVTVTKVDDKTIDFTLPQPYAPFQHALTFPVVPEHVLKDIPASRLREADFSANPVTSGPFNLRFLQVTSASDGRASVFMNANKNYYGGTPLLKQFRLSSYRTRAEIAQAMKKQEINASGDLSPNEIDQLKKIGQFDAQSYTIQNGVYALFNTESSVLKETKVRQALQMGTNMKDILKVAGESHKPLHLPFIPREYADQYPEAPKLDIEKADKLLTEAGWRRDGDGVRSKDGEPLELKMVVRKGSGLESTAGELQRQWQQLGLKVDINVVGEDGAADAFQTVLQPRNFDVLVYELAFNGDMDPYAYWHSSQVGTSGLNFSNYKNSLVDAALSSARGKYDTRGRVSKYVTLARKWLDDAPALGLYQSEYNYTTAKGNHALSRDVQLVQPTSRYANILYWAVREREVYKTP